MPTQDVNITDHQSEFIREAVASGQYSDESEVIREGLRLLEQHSAEKRAALDEFAAMAEAGFESLDRGEGVSVPLDRVRAYLSEITEPIRARYE